MTFLSDPTQIRKYLVKALEGSASLDAAVAFIGRDWANIIGTFSGSIRVICWLSSTNTNPYAVEQMTARENISVRQLPAMHAKVYLLEGETAQCIVGSSNLTTAALSEENASGQYEAGIHIRDRRMLSDVRCWFEGLWDKARPISSSDLQSAKNRWERARSHNSGSTRTKASKRSTQSVGSHFPAGWLPQHELLDLAREVREENFSGFDQYKDVLARIVDRGWRRDVRELIQFVAAWTRYEVAHRPALRQPPARIRESFSVLFDQSRSIESRLQDLDTRGDCKIPGFGLASLTMILYLRTPREYPPFNRRTQQFLDDFGFKGHVPRGLTPARYGQWIDFAQELSGRLRLPTTGHVDRLVWRHTEGLQTQ